MFGAWITIAIPFLLYGGLMVFAARVAREPMMYHSEKTQTIVLNIISGFFFVPAGLLLVGALLFYLNVLMTGKLFAGDASVEIIGLGVGGIAFGIFGYYIIGTALSLKRDPHRRIGNRMFLFRVLGWVMLIIGFPPLIAAAITYQFVVTLQQRRAERSILLWHLALAVEKELPLAEELNGVATSFSRPICRRTQLLARHISGGASLSEAMQRVRGLLPTDVQVAAEVATQNGNLSEVLKNAALHYAQPSPWVNMGVFSPSMLVNYLLFVPLFGFNIVFFIMWWIIPKFKKIFEDFGTELPAMTVALINGSDFVVNYFWMLPITMVFCLLVLVAFISLDKQFRWDISSLPIFRWLFKKQGLPKILRALSGSVEGQQTLSAPFRILAARHPRSGIRQSAAQVALGIDAGNNAWETMHYEGLLNYRQAQLLMSAEQAGNLRWALSQLADSLEKRRSFRLIVAFSFLEPAVVLSIGIITGFFVIGLFMPLIKLLNDLS